MSVGPLKSLKLFWSQHIFIGPLKYNCFFFIIQPYIALIWMTSFSNTKQVKISIFGGGSGEEISWNKKNILKKLGALGKTLGCHDLGLIIVALISWLGKVGEGTFEGWP